MEVAQANCPLLDVLLVYLTTRVSGPLAAVWSLEVGEFDNCYLCVFWSQKMPGIFDKEVH
jgi:hypothetical protein